MIKSRSILGIFVFFLLVFTLLSQVEACLSSETIERLSKDPGFAKNLGAIEKIDSKLHKDVGKAIQDNLFGERAKDIIKTTNALLERLKDPRYKEYSKFLKEILPLKPKGIDEKIMAIAGDKYVIGNYMDLKRLIKIKNSNKKIIQFFPDLSKEVRGLNPDAYYKEGSKLILEEVKYPQSGNLFRNLNEKFEKQIEKMAEWVKKDPINRKARIYTEAKFSDEIKQFAKVNGIEVFEEGVLSSSVKATVDSLSKTQIDKIVNKVAKGLKTSEKNTLKTAFSMIDKKTANEISKRMGEINSKDFEVLLRVFRDADPNGMEALKHILKQLFTKEIDEVTDDMLFRYSNLGFANKGFVYENGLKIGATDGKYLFRTTARSSVKKELDETFFNGFVAKGTNEDRVAHIMQHTKSSSDSYYISASKSPDASRGFSNGNGYLYVLKNPGNGHDAAGIIARNYDKIINLKPEYTMKRLNGYEGEFEIFFPANIETKWVLGRIRIENNKFVGNFESNFNFKG